MTTRSTLSAAERIETARDACQAIEDAIGTIRDAIDTAETDAEQQEEDRIEDGAEPRDADDVASDALELIDVPGDALAIIRGQAQDIEDTVD